MLSAMPREFYIMVGACIAAMAVSAFFLGAPQWWQRGLARSALVISAGVLFVGVTTYVSVLVAVLVVVLPVVLIVAFFTDLFSGLF